MSETKLTERQQKILNLIKESPTITGKQMSETLSVSQRTFERDLSALQKVGALKREGKDNDGKWVISHRAWHRVTAIPEQNKEILKDIEIAEMPDNIDFI